MTREEAIRELKQFSGTTRLRLSANFWEALNRAIKLLEQEPCEDAISRRAVLNTLDKMDSVLDEDRTVEAYKELLVACYNDLPPVTPVHKKEWIPVTERLPEEDGDYLLWGKIDEDEDEYTFIGSYDSGCEEFGIWQEQFDRTTLGCLGSDFFEYASVIAWMPLPEPYKEELVCKTKRGLIVISFKNFEINVNSSGSKVEMNKEDVVVSVDGVKSEKFGENFAGHQYSAEEVLEGLVIDYINNNTSIEWIEVPDSIREFKESFFEPTGIVIAGRDVPQKIIKHGFGGNILTLHYASDGFSEAYKAENPGYPKDYNGSTAYTDGDYFALLDAEGSVISDIEAFYESGISEMWEKDNIVFGKGELAEIVKNW